MKNIKKTVQNVQMLHVNTDSYWPVYLISVHVKMKRIKKT